MISESDLIYMMGILVMVLIITVVAYILSSIMYFRLFLLLKYKKPAVAWIPIYCNVCAYDAIRIRYVLFFGRKYPIPVEKYRLVPVLNVIAGFVAVIPIIGPLFSLFISIASIYGMYTIWRFGFASIEGRNYVDEGLDFMALICTFIPFVALIRLFISRPDNVNFTCVEMYNASILGAKQDFYQDDYQNQSYYQNQDYNQQGFGNQGYSQQPQGQQMQPQGFPQGFSNQGYSQQSQGQQMQPQGFPQGFGQPNRNQRQLQNFNQGMQSQGFPQNFNQQSNPSQGQDDDEIDFI